MRSEITMMTQQPAADPMTHEAPWDAPAALNDTSSR
jgi:hypothetical protein